MRLLLLKLALSKRLKSKLKLLQKQLNKIVKLRWLRQLQISKN
jgi:hypothetical protein